MFIKSKKDVAACFTFLLGKTGFQPYDLVAVPERFFSF